MWDLIVSVPDHCLSFYFNCSMVLAAPPQHGAESTRAFGLLPSAAETTIGYQWWPGGNWYRSVAYTSVAIGHHWYK